VFWTGAALLAKKCLHLLPKRGVDDGRVLAGMRFVAVANLAEIGGAGQAIRLLLA
jgi:hypothetical protein